MIAANDITPRVGQVPVGTSPTCIGARNTRRDRIAIVNNGPATVYIGFDTSVTTGNGFGLPPSVGIALDVYSTVYVIAAAGGSTVSVMETYV